MRTRTKICGITSLEDALQAIAAGADALGFVFYKPSPRYVSPEKASEIISKLPPFVEKVALFVNEELAEVEAITKLCGISLIQFHGDEDQAFCQSASLPYIKAVRVQGAEDIRKAVDHFSSARAILLDAYKKGVPGGTGESFDWAVIPESIAVPLVLAGGLNCHNVAQAIKEVKPFAVDVSGGVELRKGVKDHSKVSKFIEEVSRACEY